MPRKTEKKNPTLKTFGSSATLSSRSAELLPTAQYKCYRLCPIFKHCKYADPSEPCGLLQVHVEDIENRLTQQLSHPYTAADALLIQNALRVVAALAWADIQIYSTSPTHRISESDEDEVQTLVFHEGFHKTYIVLVKALQ